LQIAEPRAQTLYALGNPLASTRRVCTFFVLTKGAKAALQSENDDWTVAKSAWVSAIVAVGFGVLCGAVAVPILIHRSNRKFNE
jgi:ABC-type Fe3+ transport system permease subunit